MNVREQLDWEARWAKPAAAAAFGSAVLLVAATIVRQAVALSERPDDDRELLIAIHDNAGGFLAASIIQSLSFLGLAAVLFYLGRAVVARRPELPQILLWLGVLGPLLLAVAGIVSDLDRIDSADAFLASGAQTVERAEDLLDDRSTAATAIGSAGTLALAIAFVFVSVNAMRVGLLTRFMGVIGAIVGVLYVIPLLAGPLIVQLLWLGALAVLFLGRWPGGRGPAWETGEAAEWPPGLARQRADGAESPAEELVVEPATNGGADTPERSRPPRKRKKKRR